MIRIVNSRKDLIFGDSGCFGNCVNGVESFLVGLPFWFGGANPDHFCACLSVGWGGITSSVMGGRW